MELDMAVEEENGVAGKLVTVSQINCSLLNE